MSDDKIKIELTEEQAALVACSIGCFLATCQVRGGSGPNIEALRATGETVKKQAKAQGFDVVHYAQRRAFEEERAMKAAREKQN